MAIGAGAFAGGLRGFTRPERAARLIQGRRTTSVVLGAIPLVAAPLMGGRRTPLFMLMVGGVGLSNGLLGTRKGAIFTAGAAAYWCAQVAIVNGLREPSVDDKTAFTYAVIPAALASTTMITPPIMSVALGLRGLQAMLEDSEHEARSLENYREALGRALTALESAILDARAALDRPALDGFPARDRVVELLQRAYGRLVERAAVVATLDGDARPLADVVTARVEAFRWTADGRYALDVAVAPDLWVSDPRMLALLAATVSAGLANVARHAMSATAVQIACDVADGRLRLRVRDNGTGQPLATVPGEGLSHLQLQATRLSGDVQFISSPTGGCLTLELPFDRAGRLADDSMAAELLRHVDDGLKWAVRACAGQVVVMAFFSDQLAERGRTLARVLSILSIAAYEFSQQVNGTQLDRRGRQGAAGTDWDACVLMLAGVASALSRHHEHAMLPGWAGTALARYGLASSRRRLGWLTALHVTAIVASYRGRREDLAVMAAHEVGSCVLGPFLMWAVATPAIKVLEERERGVAENLSRVEETHRLAEDFHRAHSCIAPLLSAEEMLDTTPLREVLERRRGALDGTSRLLADPPSGESLAVELAVAIARRIWPVEVIVDVDITSVRQLPRAAVAAMAFRRRAVAIADRVAQRLTETYEPRWNGRWSLQRVVLAVSANSQTGTIRCRATPYPPRDSEESARLASAVEGLGGFVHESLKDGAISFDLYPQEYIELRGDRI